MHTADPIPQMGDGIIPVSDDKSRRWSQ